MSREKLLPCAMIAISLSSAVVYAIQGDMRRAIYWLSAAVITGSVTF